MAVILLVSLVTMFLVQPWSVDNPTVELKELEFVFDPTELEFSDPEDSPRFGIVSWNQFYKVSMVFVLIVCAVLWLLWGRCNDEFQDSFDHSTNNIEDLDIEELEGYVTSFFYLNEENWDDIMRNIQMLIKGYDQ
ncbi:uncharacterized protein LOC134686075 [Mytilus trossulus]|uniref:uncharacterized protein LOC134686075 n=1 Tax=Mytilus trossulus TaxID=6551 RepID=UPI003006779E